MDIGIAGLSDVLKSVASAAPVSTGASASTPGAPFAGMLRSMIDETGALDAKAKDAVSGLLSGKGVEVHDAMIATQKADMAFQLALQVRNKAVAAYQQMMTMQF